jgi:hypothetical protein
MGDGGVLLTPEILPKLLPRARRFLCPMARKTKREGPRRPSLLLFPAQIVEILPRLLPSDCGKPLKP